MEAVISFDKVMFCVIKYVNICINEEYSIYSFLEGNLHGFQFPQKLLGFVHVHLQTDLLLWVTLIIIFFEY